MRTAETGMRDDLAHLGRLDRPVVRSVVCEGEMNAILVELRHRIPWERVDRLLSEPEGATARPRTPIWDSGEAQLGRPPTWRSGDAVESDLRGERVPRPDVDFSVDKNNKAADIGGT